MLLIYLNKKSLKYAVKMKNTRETKALKYAYFHNNKPKNMLQIDLNKINLILILKFL